MCPVRMDPNFFVLGSPEHNRDEFGRSQLNLTMMVGDRIQID